MMHPMILRFAWVMAALAAACASAQPTEVPKPVELTVIEVGQPFPAITLPLLKDGRPASIADFRGEKIIMHVFASW